MRHRATYVQLLWPSPEGKDALAHDGGTGRSRGEISVGGGPILGLSGRYVAAAGQVNGRATARLNDRLGLEFTMTGLLIPRPMAGLVQGNLIVNLMADKGAEHQWIPFLTAGSGAIFPAEPTAWVVNYGGGVKYYFTKRLGIRVDVRDHLLPRVSGFHLHGIEIGGGLTFRF